MHKNFNDSRYVHGDQDVNVPAHLNFGKFIIDNLRKYKNNIALENAETHRKLTYKDLTQYAVNLAVSLNNLGVKVGDVIAVGAEKRNEFVATVLGIVFTGATYTPYDINSGRAVLKHKLSITKPRIFICSNQFWNIYHEVLKTFSCIEMIITLDDVGNEFLTPIKSLIGNNIDIDLFEPAKVYGQTDVAFILYSSGTTGMPKGVQLSHLNCILNSLPENFSSESDSLQTMFIMGEWYHNYDTFMTYKFLVMGKKIVYVENPTITAFLKTVQDKQVDIAMVVPSMVGYLSKSDELDKFNLGSLKIIYSRSSPLHFKTIENVKMRLPNLKDILQGYGMTEAGELTSESRGFKGPKVGSVGMATPGITLKVVNPVTREILSSNERGEICLRGPMLMKGYIGIDSSTYLDEDGFFRTGDLGYYDDDRYFFIVDRIKEIISYDGNKVAPLELETILQLHPGVKEAGVVGKPVPVLGEEPTAFVVRQPGSDVTDKDLIKFVAVEVSPYMQLRGGVYFLDKLPRNPRGKLMRRQLRELLSMSRNG